MRFSTYTIAFWYLLLFDFSIDAEVSNDYVDTLRGRQKKNTCGGLSENLCKWMCGGVSTLCENDVCYCESGVKQFMAIIIATPNKSKKILERLEDEEYKNDGTFLRHHIAHFCGNLNLARTCIKTCMKIGKPAFCGKDHVCYCGHKYTNHDKDKPQDPFDTYAQFRDLYEKYFGKNGDIKKI